MNMFLITSSLILVYAVAQKNTIDSPFWKNTNPTWTIVNHYTKTSTRGDTLILKYAVADILQYEMQSKSKSKKKLSDLQQKYVEWIRRMDKITQSL